MERDVLDSPVPYSAVAEAVAGALAVAAVEQVWL